MRSRSTRYAVAVSLDGVKQYLTPRKETGVGHQKRAGWSTDIGEASLFTERRFASQAAGRTGVDGWDWVEVVETRKEAK